MGSEFFFFLVLSWGFLSKMTLKNLNLFCKIDLDFWDSFVSEKTYVVTELLRIYLDTWNHFRERDRDREREREGEREETLSDS